jgi:hypothetical protein
MMTVEELRGSVPKHVRGMIKQNVVDVFNMLESDEGEDFAEHYRQNFVSMSSVMRGGQYSVKDYLDAVKYVAYKLMENSDIDAYQMTFPHRYARLMDKYRDEGDEAYIRGAKISPFVTAYKKGDLVTKVLEQSLVPSRILNAPMFQEALNIQMGLAMTANSEIVRSTAAESVMKYTMSAEAQKIELEIGIKGQDEILALRTEMHRLASQQQTTIVSGANTSLQIAEQKLLYEEAIDVEEN